MLVKFNKHHKLGKIKKFPSFQQHKISLVFFFYHYFERLKVNIALAVSLSILLGHFNSVLCMPHENEFIHGQQVALCYRLKVQYPDTVSSEQLLKFDCILSKGLCFFTEAFMY